MSAVLPDILGDSTAYEAKTALVAVGAVASVLHHHGLPPLREVLGILAFVAVGALAF